MVYLSSPERRPVSGDDARPLFISPNQTLVFDFQQSNHLQVPQFTRLYKMFFVKETRVKESWSKHNLPDEIWSEILSRLPVKSLIRFCIVSKSWQSMIGDPKFCSLHLNNFENNIHETHLLVAQDKGWKCQENYIVRSSDTFKPKAAAAFLDIAKFGKKWSAVCSIDGLVLLKYYSPTLELILWNPSIRKTRKLPPSPVVIFEEMENIDFGFGFSSLVNDYKLVRLVRQGERNLHSVAIYTVGTGLWKTVKFQGKGVSNWCWQFESSSWRTVCFRGLLYFIATHRHTQDEELVSFDLFNEFFASTLPPIAYHTMNEEFILEGVTLVLGGYLLRLVYLLLDEGCILVPERNGADFDFTRWSQLYIFVTPLPYFDGFEVQECNTPDFLYLVKNGDVLLQWDSTRVTSFSLETNLEKTLQSKRRIPLRKVFGYVESLVLVNG